MASRGRYEALLWSRKDSVEDGVIVQVNIVVPVVVDAVGWRGRRNTLAAEARLEISELTQVRGSWERDRVKPECCVTDRHGNGLGQQHDDFEAQDAFPVQDGLRRCERNVYRETWVG